MILIRRTFRNEREEEITMDVVKNVEGITVAIARPDIEEEHIYTPTEASVLRELLGLLEPAYKFKDQDS